MADVRTRLRFLCGEEERDLAGFDPALTILDWLRLEERLTGTKEGCAEGDCGACTVAVGRRAGDRVRYRAINACIRPLASLDGCHLVTVEHLQARDGTLHPVQRAMVDAHASQCGFCTPGIVMSLVCLRLAEDGPDVARIEDALAGNLCRCTGYAPIIAAGLAMGRPSEAEHALLRETARRLAAIEDERTLLIERDGRAFLAPASLEAFAEAYLRHPDAAIIAGATDAGLWLTKEMRVLRMILHPGRVGALQQIEDGTDALVIGATTSLADAAPALERLHPHLGELMRRFGGEQIRHAGTVGGNIANASPIGDLPPALIALDAALVLRRGAERRELPLERFFLAYRKQDRRPGEFVEQVRIPRLPHDAQFHVSKVSKRFDEDISAVCGAFRLRRSPDGLVREARLAFGGMAAIPKRAAAAEAALIGCHFDEDVAEAAAHALAADFKPLDDWRASARYRMRCAQNLLRRFAIETASPETATRVAGRLAA